MKIEKVISDTKDIIYSYQVSPVIRGMFQTNQNFHVLSVFEENLISNIKQAINEEEEMELKGYLHDSQDRQKWIVDEEAAPIVKRIFGSIISGKSLSKIAEELTAEGILTPATHWKNVGERVSLPASGTDPTKWALATVIQILKKRNTWAGKSSTKREPKATNPRNGKPHQKIS